MSHQIETQLHFLDLDTDLKAVGSCQIYLGVVEIKVTDYQLTQP